MEGEKPKVPKKWSCLKMSTTTKLDIMLNATGNLLPWEEMYHRKMAMLSQKVHTRSKTSLPSGSSSTEIMPEIWIFCIKKDKKHNDSTQRLISVEMGYFEEKIKKYATALGDQALLSILGSIDFVAKEIHYYGVCTTDSCRASLKNKPK